MICLTDGKLIIDLAIYCCGCHRYCYFMLDILQCTWDVVSLIIFIAYDILPAQVSTNQNNYIRVVDTSRERHSALKRRFLRIVLPSRSHRWPYGNTRYMYMIENCLTVYIYSSCILNKGATHYIVTRDLLDLGGATWNWVTEAVRSLSLCLYVNIGNLIYVFGTSIEPHIEIKSIELSKKASFISVSPIVSKCRKRWRDVIGSSLSLLVHPCVCM